jgi:hypothetical protein
LSVISIPSKFIPKPKEGGHPTQGLTVGGMTAFGGGNQFCGVGLTEDSSRCVVTGETGLTHTRTKAQFISMIFLMIFGAQLNMCGGRWRAIELGAILPSWPIRGAMWQRGTATELTPNTHEV